MSSIQVKLYSILELLTILVQREDSNPAYKTFQRSLKHFYHNYSEIINDEILLNQRVFGISRVYQDLEKENELEFNELVNELLLELNNIL